MMTWAEEEFAGVDIGDKRLNARLVYVADREADIVELMRCARDLGTPADWLIRSQHNRCLPDGGKLWSKVLAGKSLGKVDVLQALNGQAARMMRLGRTHPEWVASALLTDAEWKAAYGPRPRRILAKRAVPSDPPTIRKVICQIAMLGGFLGRKSDGEPGVKTLWLGWQRVRDFVEGVEHMTKLQAG